MCLPLYICNEKCLFKKAGESPVFQGKTQADSRSIRQVFAFEPQSDHLTG
ncbi:hypothetical protein [Moraxella lacunata]